MIDTFLSLGISSLFQLGLKSLVISQRTVPQHAIISYVWIKSVLGDLCLFSFQLVIANSKAPRPEIL